AGCGNRFHSTSAANMDAVAAMNARRVVRPFMVFSFPPLRGCGTPRAVRMGALQLRETAIDGQLGRRGEGRPVLEAPIERAAGASASSGRPRGSPESIVRS